MSCQVFLIQQLEMLGEYKGNRQQKTAVLMCSSEVATLLLLPETEPWVRDQSDPLLIL